MARQFQGDSYQMEFPVEAVGFDPDGFDGLLRTQGVEMVHWRSMRCPVGLTDPDDIRRPHQHHADCSNGFLYTKAGVVTVGFLANNKESRFTDPGRIDGSTVQIVVPRFYDDKEAVPVELAPFDRMYLKEESITVVNWHLFQANATGVDRLQFPVAHVYDLVDSNNVRYAEGVDFEVRSGQIRWLTQNRPGTDPRTMKGTVCSVRYSYRPFWYVKNLMHEVRVGQVEDPETGERSVMRFPQGAMLQREFFFEKEQRDEDAPTPNSPRQQPKPEDGGFGPR